MKFIFALQLSSFIAAVALLILFVTGHMATPYWFVAVFGTHTTADLLFFFSENPQVSVLDNFEKAVKLPTWLTFVGLMGLDGAVIFVHSVPCKIVGFLAFGLAMAGFCYEQIYP